MELVKISDLFDVNYGNSFELNNLTKSKIGVNFVSRSANNNGVSARVNLVENQEPFSSGVLTVALGGSVLETFVQPEPFYTGFHIYCLTPFKSMTLEQKLYYCMCIRSNKYRYSYGRQANRTLREILVPHLENIPEWVYRLNKLPDESISKSAINIKTPILMTENWKCFQMQDLFDIQKGQNLSKSDRIAGSTPYVSASSSNNGVTDYIEHNPIHEGGTITVSCNGSVGEAFFQKVPYCASGDVNILKPKKFKLTEEIAIFICTVIRLEKYRFNYGRKWNLERMCKSQIKLPSDRNGNPNFDFMINYIKSLPYSSQI